MATPPPSSSRRLAFIDWTRGLAALIMLQGHVFHSFTRPADRDGGTYVLSQFVGGMPPAIFLFLLGVTLAFLMHGKERKGAGAGERVVAALRRSGYLIALAFLFRLQLWVFALPHSPWTDLFRVDILNAMSLAVAVMSLLAIFPVVQRAKAAALVGLAIAGASPVIANLDWSGVHPFVRAYLVPDPLFFGFFPWASFVAFGIAGGTLLRLLREEQYDRAMQWSALAGLGLIGAARYASNLPYSVYPQSDFWLDSPALIFIKVGVILLMLSFAFVWTRYIAGEGWSILRTFGTNSLLVYWVHVELVYGFWMWWWKENLGVGGTAVLSVAVIALMAGLCALRAQWNNWTPSLPQWNGIWFWNRTERRYSGD
jgi:uncharacterized membrane protein